LLECFWGYMENGDNTLKTLDKGEKKLYNMTNYEIGSAI